MQFSFTILPEGILAALVNFEQGLYRTEKIYLGPDLRLPSNTILTAIGILRPVTSR
jgi:hypothetical protein